MKSGKRIPIITAKNIAKDFGYTQVVIHAFDGESGNQHVTTYGKSQLDCENAAAGGNAIKKLLQWDESLCNAKPARQIKKEKIKAMEEILRGIINIIDSPNNKDTINIAKFTAYAVLAKSLITENEKAN